MGKKQLPPALAKEASAVVAASHPDVSKPHEKPKDEDKALKKTKVRNDQEQPEVKPKN